MVTFRKNTRYKILTSKGFKSFKGVRRTTKPLVLVITLEDGRYLKCSKDHRFFIDSREVLAKDLQVGTLLNNSSTIVSIDEEKFSDFLYDPVDVEDGSEFLR